MLLTQWFTVCHIHKCCTVSVVNVFDYSRNSCTLCTIRYDVGWCFGWICWDSNQTDQWAIQSAIEWQQINSIKFILMVYMSKTWNSFRFLIFIGICFQLSCEKLTKWIFFFFKSMTLRPNKGSESFLKAIQPISNEHRYITVTALDALKRVHFCLR